MRKQPPGEVVVWVLRDDRKEVRGVFDSLEAILQANPTDGIFAATLTGGLLLVEDKKASGGWWISRHTIRRFDVASAEGLADQRYSTRREP